MNNLSIKSPVRNASQSTLAPISVSGSSPDSHEAINLSLQGTKSGRYSTSPTPPDRQGILPRASSTGAIKASSLSSYAISVAGVGNTIIRQVSGIVHERQSSNMSYAAAVRNNSGEFGMVIKVQNQTKIPKLLNLFQESFDKNWNMVTDISRFYAGLSYRYFYAECLQMWGLWYQRAKLFKDLPISQNIINPSELQIGIYFTF